jgi:putative two-component system response regulator
VGLAAGLWIQHSVLEAMSHGPIGGNGTAAASEMSGSTRLAVHGLTFAWIIGLQGGAAWLVFSRMHGEQQRLQNQSQEESLLRAREVLRTRDAVIFGLAKLAESRDPDTGHHLERIALYSTRLATAMRRHAKFRTVITRSFVHSIGISSALHDIGKVGVEDAILLKPGPLTAEEYSRIQLHTVLGGDCIRQIQRRVGDPMFLELAREIAMHHHERWDGGGYPHGLAGEEIPLAARIVAIADVYDALSVRRVYKDPYPHEVCVEKIRKDAGKHFDKDIVDVFLSIHEQFREISVRFAVIEGEIDTKVEPPRGDARSFAELTMTDEQMRILQGTLAGRPPVRAPVESLSAASRSRDLNQALKELDPLGLLSTSIDSSGN